jgi:hypothetical protein
VDRHRSLKQRWLLIAMASAMLLGLFGLATCVASWERVERESEARIDKQRRAIEGPTGV